MKISLKWLNDFVDVSDYLQKTQELSDILTKAGLEVEEITDRAKDFKNVVVGHIKIKDKHPNADKLSLCQVEIAPGNIQQIVCGAQNHKAGDKVIVALAGAVLPGNFAIKKSKIRDVESNGMLCSLKELGLAETSDGIAILPADAPVGKSYAEFAGYDDVTFELKVTPNRADCLSHYGLAREIGCLLNRPVKKPEMQTKFSAQKTSDKIKLSVQNSEHCPRYCGRYISGVKIGESPAWLKARLDAIGVNSINNVVDVTNYVMHEMGQPLHAFDADLLVKSEVLVRDAKKGEKFKTLKEQEIVLSGEELLICDGEKAVALAGVIGGLNSGVSDSTKNIFLESANFQAMSVRKSSRAHGIETDSAYRFSRGVDPSQTQEIMDRAVLLITQIAGGDAYDSHYDIYPKPVTKAPVKITLETVSDRLGYPAEEKLFTQFMQGLQCKVEKKGNDFFVTPPLFRFDLERDMDLVEEYARLKGYEHITETIPQFAAEPKAHAAEYMLARKLSEFFRAEGYSQAFNYAFTSDVFEGKFLAGGDLEKQSNQLSQYEKWGLATDVEPIRLKNPLSEEINIMRRSLNHQLWKNIFENFHAGNAQGQLFEIGSVFSKKEGAYKETRRLSLALWGDSFGLYAEKTPLIYKLKSTLEKLMQLLQVSAYTFQQKDNESGPPYLHRGQWASLFVEGKQVGVMGSAHPLMLNQEKVRVPVAFAEINLDLLVTAQARPVKFKALSGFQPVERDFAFVMDSIKPVGDLLKEAKKSAGAHYKDAVIFDIYEGDKLPQGQKSVALRLSLQSFDAPLTDEQIQQISAKLIAGAEKTAGAKLRA